MFDKNVNQAAIAALKRIYKAKGEAAFRHPHAIPAYLNDLLPGSDYEPCRRLIKSACENGTYALLLIQGAGSMSSRVERATEQLQEKAFINKEVARCTVEWAACALDPSYQSTPNSSDSSGKQNNSNVTHGQQTHGSTISAAEQDIMVDLFEYEDNPLSNEKNTVTAYLNYEKVQQYKVKKSLFRRNIMGKGFVTLHDGSLLCPNNICLTNSLGFILNQLLLQTEYSALTVSLFSV